MVVVYGSRTSTRFRLRAPRLHWKRGSAALLSALTHHTIGKIGCAQLLLLFVALQITFVFVYNEWHVLLARSISQFLRSRFRAHLYHRCDEHV